METTALNEKPGIALPQRGLGRVLLVDDEEPNRILLRDSLALRGYEVLEADSSLQALRLIATSPPDAILLDVMMPGMDGFQLCRRLKRDRQTAPIPILMITALSARKERLMGIEAGANDFLAKPVDMQDLILRVANAVYAKHLFDKLQVERENSERLLLNILPRPIAERMKKGQTSIADHHPDVTVLLADLVGFTALTSHVAPEEIVSLLNEIFSTFDLLAEKHRLEKIKTMGDAYMVAAGLPSPRPDHAEAVAQFALELRLALEEFNTQYDTSIQIRIGFNAGPVIAGVIGRKKFAYDLWGDTVNVACRLESMAQPGSIQVSQATCQRLKGLFRFDNQRTLDVKGCGPMVVWNLIGRAA